MTHHTATQRTAQDAYQEHRDRAAKAVEAIAAWLESQKFLSTNGNWGYAGSMAHFASDLEEVAAAIMEMK